MNLRDKDSQLILIVIIYTILISSLINFAGYPNVATWMVIISSVIYYYVCFKKRNDVFNPGVFPLFICMLYFLIPVREPAPILEEGELLERYNMVVFSGLAGVYIGFLLSRPSKIIEGVSFRVAVVNTQWSNVLLALTWFLGFLGFIGIVAQVGVPIFKEDLYNYRIEMQNKIAYFGLLMLMFKGYIVYIYLAALKIYTTRSRFITANTSIGLLLALVFLSSFGNRGLVIFPLFTFIVIRHYVYKRVSFLQVVGLFVLLTFLIGFLGYYRSLSEGGVVYAQVFSRVIHELSIAKYNLMVVLSIFPEQHSYMLGGGFFSSLLTLLPGKQYLIDWYIKDLSDLQFEGGGLPPTLFGLFYLDFSFIGVFLLSLLLGYLLMKVYRMAVEKSYPIIYVIYAFLLELAISGIRNMLIPEIFLIYTMLILLFLYNMEYKNKAIQVKNVN